MNRFKIFWMAICLVAAACSMGIHGARADVLLSFPPPTTNLNLTPGDANYADRSNFGVSGIPLNYPVTDSYKIAGDSFSIGSAGQQYHIDSITLWIVFGLIEQGGQPVTQFSTGNIPDTNIENLALWFGPEGGATKTSFSEVHPRYWYSTGENYLRVSESVWVGLREITFATDDLTINGGQTYNYFLDGYIVLSRVSNTNEINTWRVPSLHFTNSDGAFSWYEVGTGEITKSTSLGDVNVEIKGTLVCNPAPLPSSLLLLGSCLGVLALGRKK